MKKHFLVSAALAVATTFGANAIAQEAAEAPVADSAVTFDQLLNDIRNNRYALTQEHQEREARFARERNNQQALLRQAEAEETRQQQILTQLEADYEENTQKIRDARARLNEAKGDLGELFGHLQGFAGDSREIFKNSITSVQYGQREQAITDMIAKLDTTSDQLPTIAEIEALWFEVQREMVATGEVVSFNADVTNPNGESNNQAVTRVGVFNLVSEGKYLSFNPTTGIVSELPRQRDDALSGAESLGTATTGLTAFKVDPTGPTGGTLLNALIDTPTIEERIAQGKQVGYIIIAIGIIGVLIALLRMVVLVGMSAKVKSQAKSEGIDTKNPLGRILQVAADNETADLETLELKISEQILKERPAIEKGVNIIKIIGAVAPLLGLLGTVTGMIITFQAITIFGAGDPTAMAGGISAALMTTVLGLCVAIPMVLLHTIVAGRSKSVLAVLEEQATGIVATRSEAK
jgi:biopolymer transport protein ExbB